MEAWAFGVAQCSPRMRLWDWRKENELFCLREEKPNTLTFGSLDFVVVVPSLRAILSIFSIFSVFSILTIE